MAILCPISTCSNTYYKTYMHVQDNYSLYRNMLALYLADISSLITYLLASWVSFSEKKYHLVDLSLLVPQNDRCLTEKQNTNVAIFEVISLIRL